MKYPKITRGELNELIKMRISPSSNMSPFLLPFSLIEMFEFIWEYEQLISRWSQEQSGLRKIDAWGHFEQNDFISGFYSSLKKIGAYYIFDFEVLRNTKEYIEIAHDWQPSMGVRPITFIENYLQHLEAGSSKSLTYGASISHQNVLVNFFNNLNVGIQKKFKSAEVLNISHEEAQAHESFDEIVSQKKKVQVICVDIEFNVPDKQEYNYAYVNQVVANSIPSLIQVILESTEHLLDLHTALLPNKAYSLNLQCVFVLAVGKNEIQEDTFLSQLDYHIRLNWELHFNFIQWKLINWNDLMRARGGAKSVGVIKASDPQAIELCKYWVISPVYSFNQVFSFYFVDEFGFQLNIERSNLGRLNQIHEGQALQNNFAKNWPKIIKDFLNSPYQASNKIHYLSDGSKDYLNASSLIYAEYDQTLGLADQAEFLRGKLYPIEVFMETLKFYGAELIRLPQQAKPIELIGKPLLGHLTQLGKLWYEITYAGMGWYDKFVSIRLTVASANIKIFQKFVIENNLTLQMIQSHNGQAFLDLRASIAKLQRILDSEPSHQKNYAKIERRLKVHKNYLNSILHGEMVVYRAELSGSSDGDQLTQNELSDLFTEFMRIGKQAKPLSWLRGHVIRWDQSSISDGKRKNYGDVTFVFDKNEKNHNVDIVPMLQDYLQKYIEKRLIREEISIQASKKEAYKNGNIYEFARVKKPRHLNLKLETKTVWSSIEQLDFKKLVLEKEKHSLKKVLLEKYLPALEYLDLFIPIEPQPKKRCTTGSLPNEKIKKAKNKEGETTTKQDDTTQESPD